MPAALPPLKSLVAFEAVARHGSVTRAAAELGVTQPAVTQQLRRLEGFLGRPLVARVPAGIRLTPDGSAYAARLRHAFDEVKAATAELLPGAGPAPVVTVAVLATFAQRWLIPRLVGFQEAHPAIEIRLLTTSRLSELEREDVDLSIRDGHGRWPGFTAERLMANEAFPVASPALQQRRRLERPADLAGHVLIRVEAEPRAADWPRWLALAGVERLEPASWLTFANSAQGLEAAVAGLGVAIGHTGFVADALQAGRLTAPLEPRLTDLGACYLVARADRPETARAAEFRKWLLAEAGAGSFSRPWPRRR
jgi:LysR family transcriptional regulator, glycine cleavage system transcriptional activator